MAAGLLMVTGNVLPRPAHPPALLDIRAVPTGELGFERKRPLVDIRDLRPGRTAAGSYGATTLANLTGKPMRVESRVVTSGRDLDDLVRARILLGRRVMATGTLAQLRPWTESGYVLPVGGKRSLRMIAWMPAGEGVRYEGLAASARLELRARSAG